MAHKLSEKTLGLAREALLGKWGKLLVHTDLKLTAEENAEPDKNLRYAYCIKKIAEEGLIRISPDELVIGSTMYKESPFNNTPVLSPEGYTVCHAGSHVTLGFDRAVKTGIKGFRNHIDERIARGDITEERQLNFLKACRICIDAMSVWHRRYMELLDKLIDESEGEQKAHYEKVKKYSSNVPENAPSNFREAVQSLAFQFVFQRHCGNWPGIGRIDAFLGDYLKKDLANGDITIDEAREYIAHLWIKGCEWAGQGDVFDGSGDGQYYQNVILSGCDIYGNDIENDVTFLVLDVVEETVISDFPIAVRISKRSSEKLLRRIAEVQRLGTGTVAVYNNDFIIDNLVRFGYDTYEARDFANDGCWEVQIPGKTCFTYYPYDMVTILDSTLGVKEGKTPDYPKFDDLYAAWLGKVKEGAKGIIYGSAEHWSEDGAPNVLMSIYTDDCIERARGYFDRGPRYTVMSPHAGGLPDAIDSLWAIKKLVYDEKKIDLDTLVSYLRDDWKGHEEFRQRLLKDFVCYGNDEPEIDAFGKKVLHDFSWFQREIKIINGIRLPAGASTFGREIAAAADRQAQASGRHAHEILAANLTPTPGTDKVGPTAIIKSLGALDLTSLVNGTALDIKLAPSSVQGEEGVAAMVGLYKTFVEVGGIFMHIDVVDNKTLLDAQQHPDKYPTLAVRVSGWSARFVTLNRGFQDMVIKKSMQTKM